MIYIIVMGLELPLLHAKLERHGALGSVLGIFKVTVNGNDT